MATETMTPGERLWAAIRLEKPDRVPVLPALLPEPAAGLTGVSQASVAADNHGDVPAALLAVGEPHQVEDYCKRRIDDIGADGGYILGSGCSVPPNVRPENFRAFIETGKCYELSRS